MRYWTRSEWGRRLLSMARSIKLRSTFLGGMQAEPAVQARRVAASQRRRGDLPRLLSLISRSPPEAKTNGLSCL